MKSLLRRSLLAISTTLLCTAQLAYTVPPATRPQRVIGYFTEWSSGREYNVADIHADLLTHINYAFALIKNGECSINDAAAATEKTYPSDSSDGATTLHGHFRQLQLLKQKHPDLKTLVSVGGWTGSAPFYEVAASEEARRKFARSCATFINKYGFDGVDIDWEFPGGGGADEGKGSPQDTANFTLLLAALRGALDEQGKTDQKQYLLTIATSAGPNKYQKIELDKIHPYLDWINIMTYDLAGGWSPVTDFNAPLFPSDPKAKDSLSVDGAVQAYLKAGVPSDKLVVGVPFYGHAFGGVQKTDDGLSQAHDHKSPKPASGGEWTYRLLAADYINKVGRRFWSDSAKVPWLYDEATKVWISYDDPESLAAKARYVHEKHLGGVMIWELSQDDDQTSLLNAIDSGLRGK